MLPEVMASLDPYQPSESSPWNLRRVHHLHQRAGFAANWGELQRDLADGPAASVDRLLHGSDRGNEFESLQKLIGDAAVASDDINRLKAWWFYRMLFSADPLRERLTLMWHNHFATSNVKVENVQMMKHQNDQIRTHALGNFGDLLRGAVKNSAMMVWLDGNANRKGKPNENLARELMELFTLGEGNYDETDVKEVARALTGWAVREGEFSIVDAYHDSGKKLVLGQSGEFDGDDVLQILIEHPATARRVADRLVELFFGERAAKDVLVESLAEGLREHDLDIGWAVETILRSSAFFADDNIGDRVREPVAFMMGTLRSLELTAPPPSTLLLAEWSA
ncbi:MAG: DUF1800 domain-containing protein, partial [Planctomycetota bacterium]